MKIHLVRVLWGGGPARRQVKWDLLRSLAMLGVVVVHSGSLLNPIMGINVGGILSRLALICDPVFFALSGYFGIREMRCTYGSYCMRKISSVVLPLVVYSMVLYLYQGTGTDDYNISGYIRFFSDQLSPWWFIPCLLPFLAIAPFLFVLFDGLTDRQVRLVAGAAVLMSGAGALLCLLSWLFRVSGHETLEIVVGLAQRFIPVSLFSYLGYLVYFCMGYFLRRLLILMSASEKRIVIGFGLAAWALDAYFAYEGIDLIDPSYFWLLGTAAIFFIFDRVQIESRGVSAAVEWAARRSYSIYLLQYTTISISTELIYEVLLHGCVGSLFAPVRLGFWILLVFIAWIISLAVASLIDCTALKLIQAGFMKIAKRAGSGWRVA